jgi:hypothetical protein
VGERIGPQRGNPSVVDVAEAIQRLERLGAGAVVDPRAREPLVDLLP